MGYTPVSRNNDQTSSSNTAENTSSLEDVGDFDLSFFINNIVEGDPLSTVTLPVGETSSVKMDGPSPVANVSLKPRLKSSNLETTLGSSPNQVGVNIFNPSFPNIPTDFSALDPIS